MRIRGRRTLEAHATDVFAAICDPATLLAVIPGCSGIERDGDEYRGSIALRLPGIAGSYRTRGRLTKAEPPTLGLLEGEAVGALGTVRGEATFRLSEANDRTTVDYDGTATIDGPLARLDGRFIEGIVSSLVGQGLERLEQRLRVAAADAPTR